MERVAFLIEETNERLGCLLNPDSLVMRRVAGVTSRHSSGGQLTGAGLHDDPLLYTGGGRTELELCLLFDVSLQGSSIETSDVRDLTAPLWNLAENSRNVNGQRRPPLVRFVWGKSWNIPGIITAVAERLEQFTADGAAQRSWLRLRLLRVSDGASEPASRKLQLPAPSFTSTDLAVSPNSVPEDKVQTHVVSTGERLDAIAARYYTNEQGNVPELWRLLASFNDIQNPFDLPAGLLLRIPPFSVLGGGS